MQPIETDFSFKSFFTPLTNLKAIHIIIIVGFIVFFNSLFNGFVWDDTSYLLENPGVQSFNIPLQFAQNLFNNSGQYRALTALYFTLSYSLFGPNPFMYHLIQIALHCINAILVFLFLKYFFKPKLSLLLSLLFLVHPLQVESVAYISSAGGNLFFLFGMVMLVTLKKKLLTTRHWIIISISLLLSLLAKEAGILFIFIGITFTFFFNKKYFIHFLLLSLGVLLIYFGIRFGIGEVYFDSRPLIPIARATFVQRLMTMPEIFFYYISKFFVPIHLSIYQQWVTTSLTANFGIAFVSLIAIVMGMGVVFKKYIQRQTEGRNTFIFFFLWSLAGLGLYSQIVPLDMTVADRWMYFPMVGFLGIIGTVTIYTPLKKYQNQLLTVGIIILSIFSLITIWRNTFWYNSIALYRHDTVIHTNFLLENDYAQQLKRVGEINEALIHQKKSVELFMYEQNLLNLGDLYEVSGDIPKAEHYYTLALQSKSYIPWQYKHIVFSYTKLGKVLLKENKTKEALDIINEGIKDYGESPNSGTLWYLRALLLYQLHRHGEALASAQKASVILPVAASIDLYTKLQTNTQININPYLAILP